MMEPLSKVLDVFFNGRPAGQKKGAVTIEELIRRGSSVVLVDGVLYRVEVTKAELKART